MPEYKTTTHVSKHLIPVLSSIVIEYLESESNDSFDIGKSGFYERCMEVKNIKSCMHGACCGGYMPIVELMIEKGANNFTGCIDTAEHCGYYDIVSLLQAKRRATHMTAS